MKLSKFFQERGILKDISNIDLLDNLTTKAVYIGFDPTATSLHLGNYLQIVVLKWMFRHNFNVFAVLGGATGAIGDPSGKKSERPLMNQEILSQNKQFIRKQLEDFQLQVVDNLDFYKNMNVLDFLRNVGKNINVSAMVNKDIIKKRLETGVSFAEMSYQLIQGYDFCSMYENHNVSVQIGGSDQWGNIVTGLELIHTKYGNAAQVVGMTTQLLLKADGSKFGKSETGAIWLDRKQTSPFQLYQFLLNQSDKEVEKLLLRLTFLSFQEIQQIMLKHKVNKINLHAQKTLAAEVVRDIHSQNDLDSAIRLTEFLYQNKTPIKLYDEEITLLTESIPMIKISEISLLDALLNLKVVKSQRQAKELIAHQAIKVNDQVIDSATFVIKSNSTYQKGKFSLIRKGKRNNYLILHRD